MLDKQVGFTGTQKGMTDMQKKSVAQIISLYSPGIFHHGCCIGADFEFHKMCDVVGNTIILHPPTDERKMEKCLVLWATCIGLEAKPYLERNHQIVNCSDVLIAAPAEREEVLRSGTWATLRYAKAHTRRPIFHVEPDGAVVKYNLPDDFKIWPKKENKGWVPI